MVWQRGIRRNQIDASAFLSAVPISSREIARRLGVSDRTVRRWKSGEDWCSEETIFRIAKELVPDVSPGWCPIYAPDMAIDGNTRVGGVGQYSIDSAKGKSHR